ncbi:MAG: 3-hydroxyisobutyrate dehydrogenase [Pseudomonadota bacterium]
MANIAFIGLGNMGSCMCANLLQASHTVKAFDLNPAAVRAATEQGAIAASDIAAAVSDADFVITMLPAGEHVHSVYFSDSGVAEHAKSDALFIDCSTIAVEDARKAHRRADESGFAMLDAPVSGGVAAAGAGTLTFMVGGAGSAFEHAEPILAAMGENIFHAGPSGNGQAAKVANNMLLGISMIATCEAFNLAQKLGLDAQTFFDISSKASGQCWSMTSYCPVPGPVPASPANNNYDPGFTVAMMLKDLNLARQAASDVDAVIDFGEQAAELYDRLSEAGMSARDFSVVMQTLAHK